MNAPAKIFWPTSFRLTPQHLQHSAAYRSHLLQARLGHVLPGAYGLVELDVDTAALGERLLRITRFVGVTQEGTLLESSGVLERQLSTGFALPTDFDVFLGIARHVPDVPAVAADGSTLSKARYRREDVTVVDEHALSGMGQVSVLVPNLRVLYSSDEKLDEFECVQVGRVTFVDGVAKWTRTIPALLDIAASPNLLDALRDLHRLLSDQRTRLLEERRWKPNESEHFVAADMLPLLLVMTVSRFEPRLADVLARDHVLPEEAHALLASLLAALQAIVQTGTEASAIPPFDREQLGPNFKQLVNRIRTLLLTNLGDAYFSLEMLRKDASRYEAQIPEAYLARPLRLAAYATDDDGLLDRLPALAKTAGPSAIDSLTHAAAAGVALSVDRNPPAVLPKAKGCVYYVLDRASPFWPEIAATGRIVLFLPALDKQISFRILALKP